MTTPPRKHVRQGEKGAALPFVAGILVVLIGLSALAVDLGWLYLNSSRLQRAADAAALAGVVHLPSDSDAVDDDTASAAGANGFPIGTGSNTLSWQALDDNKLEVTLGATAPSFFTQVLGFETFDLEARSTAEYVKPVPMGSPSSCFGVGAFAIASLPSSLSHCTAFTQNFWAAINGPLTAKEQGDPFAVRCITANGSGCTGGPNTLDYRAEGYYYAVEIPAGKASFTVRLFDAGFYDRPNFQTEAGDGDGLSGSANGGMVANYQLYRPDSTPLDPKDNTPISGCGLSINPEADAGTYKNRWASLCTVNPPAEGGLYVLRVSSSSNRGGNNSYSVGVSVLPNSGTRARVYGVNDMSLFTNGTSGTATVYLAEIDPIHAGKNLELRFYDPGENTSNAWVEVKRPDGTTPSCQWIAEDLNGTQTASGSGSCRIQSTQSGTARFNGEWLTVFIDIPATYTCTTDCFWKMNLDMSGSQDRTTWTARVIGNPVRLVSNE